MHPSNKFGTIIQIGDILVSEDVIMEFFSCDFESCKGCCCVEGDSGAPLEEAELNELERYYDTYSELMPQAGKDAVDKTGFFDIDREGDLVTPVVAPGRECAYAFFENGACLCSIERCFCQNRIPFRKPFSCWLYPIRVTKLTGGGIALNVHHWDICKKAFEKGRQEGMRVYQYLREPLVMQYGQDFYDALCAAAEHLIKDRR